MLQAAVGAQPRRTTSTSGAAVRGLLDVSGGRGDMEPSGEDGSDEEGESRGGSQEDGEGDEDEDDEEDDDDEWEDEWEEAEDYSELENWEDIMDNLFPGDGDDTYGVWGGNEDGEEEEEEEDEYDLDALGLLRLSMSGLLVIMNRNIDILAVRSLTSVHCPSLLCMCLTYDTRLGAIINSCSRRTLVLTLSLFLSLLLLPPLLSLSLSLSLPLALAPSSLSLSLFSVYTCVCVGLSVKT